MQTLNNWQINGLSFPSVGAATTSAQYFPAPTANFTTGAGSTPNASSAAGQLAVPGDNKLNGQPFRIYASGDVIAHTTSSPTVTIELVANTGTVASPSYTVIATTGAVTPASYDVWYGWEIEVLATGSTNSGALSGYQNVAVGAVVEKACITLAAPLSGLVFGPSSATTQDQRHAETGSGPVFGLVVRVTFSQSSTSSKANMYRFAIES